MRKLTQRDWVTRKIDNQIFVRLTNLQILRCVAAVSVLIYHLYLWEKKAAGQAGVLPEWSRTMEAGVDLFFVISGFLMVYISPKPFRSIADWWQFILHRFIRIYPPYWIVTAVLIPLWLLRPNLFNNFYENKVDIFSSLLLFPQNYTPLLGVGWTLIHEVSFYIIVSFALFFGQFGRWLFGFAWSAVVIVGSSFASGEKAGPVTLLIFSPFSLTFILGYFLGLINENNRSLSRSSVMLIGAAALAGVVWVMPGYVPSGVYPHNGSFGRFIYFGLPVTLIVAAFVYMERYYVINAPILRRIGDASYSVYLIHLPIVSAVYLCARYFGGTIFWVQVVSGLLGLFLPIVAAVFFSEQCEMRILKRLQSHLRR